MKYERGVTGDGRGFGELGEETEGNADQGIEIERYDCWF
jgi:hypothetical protein